ncbi:MAG TPA: nucleoid occlusion factor SlmA [Burkholderiales bacterium]|nr:nucleoid occlusion factor SlmA [Burkholderiales bacterium]
MASKKPGERKLQILQVLAEMLQDPKGEKITTAALAERLEVSEAALYRHFASKAQMYEGLIEFIENSLFTVINQITADEQDGLAQARAIVGLLLSFAEKNPGMTRVLIGDVLMNENPRLQTRINQLHDRLESTLKQCLRVAATQGDSADAGDFSPQANLMLSFAVGRWHQYAKSGFKRKPAELFEKQWPLLI